MHARTHAHTHTHTCTHARTQLHTHTCFITIRTQAEFLPQGPGQPRLSRLNRLGQWPRQNRWSQISGLVPWHRPRQQITAKAMPRTYNRFPAAWLRRSSVPVEQKIFMSSPDSSAPQARYVSPAAQLREDSTTLMQSYPVFYPFEQTQTRSSGEITLVCTTCCRRVTAGGCCSAGYRLNPRLCPSLEPRSNCYGNPAPFKQPKARCPGASEARSSWTKTRK